MVKKLIKELEKVGVFEMKRPNVIKDTTPEVLEYIYYLEDKIEELQKGD